MEFDAWWQLYPRKTAKGAARKAFEKALRHIDFADLMDATERYRAHVEAGHVEKRYTPHPSTWLNQERWDDDLDWLEDASTTAGDVEFTQILRAMKRFDYVHETARLKQELGPLVDVVRAFGVKRIADGGEKCRKAFCEFYATWRNHGPDTIRIHSA